MLSALRRSGRPWSSGHFGRYPTVNRQVLHYKKSAIAFYFPWLCFGEFSLKAWQKPKTKHKGFTANWKCKVSPCSVFEIVRPKSIDWRPRWRGRNSPRWWISLNGCTCNRRRIGWEWWTCVERSTDRLNGWIKSICGHCKVISLILPSVICSTEK